MKRFIYGLGANYPMVTLSGLDLYPMLSLTNAHRFGTHKLSYAFLGKLLCGLSYASGENKDAKIWFSRYTWFR